MLAAGQVTFRDFASCAVSPAVTFVVDGKEYKCQLGTMCLISPVIMEKVTAQADTGRIGPVSLVFHFEKLKDPHGYFPQFLELVSGGEIEINENNVFFLDHIANELRIQQLQIQTAQIKMGIKLTQASAIDIARNLGEHGLPTEEVTSFILKHWKFFEGKRDLLTLPKDTLDELFDADWLEPPIIHNESVIFDMICQLVKTRGHDFSTLFRHCRMGKLDSGQMEKLISLVSFDEIPPAIFDALEGRLLCRLEDEENEEEEEEEDVPVMYQPVSQGHRMQPDPIYAMPHVAMFSAPQMAPVVAAPIQMPAQVPVQVPQQVATQKAKEAAKKATPPKTAQRTNSQPVNTQARPKTSAPVAPAKNSVFNSISEYKWYESYDEEDFVVDGVFRQMKREISTREWNKYVNVSGGGSKDKMLCHIFEFDYDMIFEYHWDNYDSREGTIKASNAWLKFQFPEHKLVLTHYTIATSSKQFPYNAQPKSWKLEGSNDGKTWVLLSQVKNSDRLRNKKTAIATFPVTAKSRAAYSHFKLTQLENCAKPTASNYGEMRINAIEFYGTLMKI